MLRQLFKKSATAMMPRLAARILADRYANSVRTDESNVFSAKALATLLLPYDIVSFDFFDTIVWREIALADVHRKTSEFADNFVTGDDGPLPRGLLLHSRGRFQGMVKQRGKAETPPRNEVDLREVFDRALEPYIKSPRDRASAVQALLDYEIETESQVLTVDPEMRELLIRLRTQGKIVILISDMYLGEEQMLPLLDKLGLKELFHHVFVSATVGVTKHSGLLFSHVDETLSLQGKRRFHLGDNWTNDVVRPREFGWDALHYFNHKNEQRKYELETAERLGARSDRRASRKLLAAMQVGNEHDGTLNIMAACLSLFARQTLSTAITGGFDRVLFLTRDGTLFHELANQFLLDCGALPELKRPALEPFAFSRRAGILLNYPKMTSPHWQEYLRSNTEWVAGHPASLRGILKALGLGAEDLTLEADERQIVETCLADTNPKTDIGFDDLIRYHKNLIATIDTTLIARRDRIRRYIDETGLLSRNEKILLVDIGYSGTAAKAISEYMNAQECDGHPIRSRMALLMLAGNRYFKNNLSQMHPRICLLPPELIKRDSWQHRALAANFSWLEPFTVDRLRGGLRDFQEGRGGDLVPVFAPAPALYKVGGIDRKKLLAAAREVDRALRQSSVPQDSANCLVIDTLVQNFTRPKAATVRSLTAVTHHAGIGEVQQNDVVTEIRPLHLLADVRRCMYGDHWVQGSLKKARLGWLILPFNILVGLMSR